jgi:hypothetical protein
MLLLATWTSMWLAGLAVDLACGVALLTLHKLQLLLLQLRWQLLLSAVAVVVLSSSAALLRRCRCAVLTQSGAKHREQQRVRVTLKCII